MDTTRLEGSVPAVSKRLPIRRACASWGCSRNAAHAGHELADRLAAHAADDLSSHAAARRRSTCRRHAGRAVPHLFTSH